MGIKRFVGALVLGGVAVAGLSGCSSVDTPPDLVALQYNGGPIEDRSFQGCIDPSTHAWHDMGDSYYQYPISQRYYEFNADNPSDNPPIAFVSADGIEMTVTGVINFTLNTDCESLRAFHEGIGARSAAYFTDETTIPDGWRTVLDVYIGEPLNTAVDRAGQSYKYADLYNDTATKAAWERDVLELLPGLVNRQTGGGTEYFKDFTITLQKPEPPKPIKDALVEQQAAVARANAAKAEAEASVAAAQAQVEVERAQAEKAKPWIDALGREGYLQKQAIEKGVNPFQPTGTTVTAPAE